ncbi:MAG: hypothetical protein GC192_05865 [Bacteroidetes bacterium]|nr:hypothetical protein [Bacteroidota bacterium]
MTYGQIAPDSRAPPSRGSRDAWMNILLRECEVLFEERVDYRIRDWAAHEVMVNASNLFHDFRDDMAFLYEGDKAVGK